MAQVDSENSTVVPVTATRRRFLTQAALVAAGGAVLGATLPLPEAAGAVQPADTDPAFSLIEAHRAAYATYYASIDDIQELEAVLPNERQQSFLAVGNETIVETDDPRWIAALKHEQQTYDLHAELAFQIAELPASTAAGLATLVAYVSECEDLYDIGVWPEVRNGKRVTEAWQLVFHRNLARALAALVDGVRA